MQQNDDGPCCAMVLLLALLAAAGYVVYRVILFLTSPGALQSILEFFKAVLMCAGLGLLVLVIFGLWTRFAPAQPRLKLKRLSREYTTRCHAYEIEAYPGGYISSELAEVAGQEPVDPVYLTVTITNLGLRISPELPAPGLTWLPVENAQRYMRLSGDRPGPVIIGLSSFQLFYLITRQEDSRVVEQTPAGQAGYSGALPSPGPGERIKIVMLYNAVILESNLEHAVPRGRPLKLKIEGIDRNGEPDASATRDLYAGLLKLVNSIAPEDDDSWMYRSRPIYW